MFGKRKQRAGTGQRAEPSATPPAAGAETGAAEPAAATPEAGKAPANTPTAAQPAKPSKPVSRPDPTAVLNRTATAPSHRGETAPRRGGARTGPAGGRGDGEDGRKLIVGKEIALSGQIKSCDKLLVEGTIEAELSDSVMLEVAPSGSYSGTAIIDTADIAGRFDGDLTVRERLYVRATGQVHGTIRYRALEIEGGGRIGGTLVELGDDDIATLRRDEEARLAAGGSVAATAGGDTGREPAGTASAPATQEPSPALHEAGAGRDRDLA